MEPSLIPVFAQQMINLQPEPAASAFTAAPAIIVPLFAMLIPIVVVPTALGIRYARQKREMEHRERMKALEVGRPLPGDEPEWSPMRVALKIGAGVPVSVMGIAWLANLTLGNNSALTIWQTAGYVSIVAVISGAVLALKAFALGPQPRQDSRGHADAARKPAFDPDAYDHVGTRG